MQHRFAQDMRERPAGLEMFATTKRCPTPNLQTLNPFTLQIDQLRRQAQEMRKRRRLFDEEDNDDGDNGDSRGYSTGSSSDGEASVAELSENSRVAGQMLYNLPKYSSVPERRKGVTPAQPSLMYDDDDDEW